MFEFASFAFNAVVGFAFGKIGLWGPDQPFDPDDPINPVATSVTAAITGVLSGYVTALTFGKEQLVLSAIGAAAGSMVLVRAARALGLISRKK